MNNSITRFLISACMLLGLATNLFAQDVTITIKSDDTPKVEVKKDGKPPFTGTRPAVDVAILLDTSNSMDGLISQAKSQLWTIVQQFANAEKAGKTPQLRVSVFEYGNTKLPASENYIRQVVQLTDDLDEVSEALFSLKTNGGDEYCGTVINEAVKRLDWADKANSYKAIFIAGNEPFTQGPTNYKDGCKAAIENGITVNTIHCGDYQTGISTKWKDGADLAEGEYMNINQDRKTVHIETPHDDIIIKLNAELNKTYLWYGDAEAKQKFQSNQIRQDSNSAMAGRSAQMSRFSTKGGSAYGNVNRDLVDSIAADDKLLEKVKESDLPEAMQGMSKEQRAQHVVEMTNARKEIQAKIKTEVAKREKLVAAKRKELAEAGGDATLGDAMSAAVVRQLKASGFEIKK
jgi:hypothetical protein